ncbi:uncharacterized protein LOC127461011 isoform X1 [Manacus candei]|uniref:uncharacterized protein LOC127461011 isoform X1 n=1 Tax=Manacus candei TaxID=415023 RepID=UPI002227615B|nr:uncharacterized protein LOC127461011 isoform X1 [Manacus candei]
MNCCLIAILACSPADAREWRTTGDSHCHIIDASAPYEGAKMPTCHYTRRTGLDSTGCSEIHPWFSLGPDLVCGSVLLPAPIPSSSVPLFFLLPLCLAVHPRNFQQSLSCHQLSLPCSFLLPAALSASLPCCFFLHLSSSLSRFPSRCPFVLFPVPISSVFLSRSRSLCHVQPGLPGELLPAAGTARGAPAAARAGTGVRERRLGPGAGAGQLRPSGGAESARAGPAVAAAAPAREALKLRALRPRGPTAPSLTARHEMAAARGRGPRAAASDVSLPCHRREAASSGLGLPVPEPMTNRGSCKNPWRGFRESLDLHPVKDVRRERFPEDTRGAPKSLGESCI